jgi:hypothetical protein
MTENEIMKKLKSPFRPDELEWRVGSTNADKTKGLALVYVDNRAIQNRLDDVFGPFGWKNEFKEWRGNSQLCGISIKFLDEWITKWDGADDSNTEAIKGGLSDSMKRAAYQWGIGRYLYEFPQQWCKLKKVGNSYMLDETPKIPEWALPEGYKKQQQPSFIQAQQSVAKEKVEEKAQERAPQPNNNGLKWDTFKANVATFGLNNGQVLLIASEVFRKQVTSLSDVITTQAELNKFTGELRKHSQKAG